MNGINGCRGRNGEAPAEPRVSGEIGIQRKGAEAQRCKVMNAEGFFASLRLCAFALNSESPNGTWLSRSFVLPTAPLVIPPHGFAPCNVADSSVNSPMSVSALRMVSFFGSLRPSNSVSSVNRISHSSASSSMAVSQPTRATGSR